MLELLVLSLHSTILVVQKLQTEKKFDMSLVDIFEHYTNGKLVNRLSLQLNLNYLVIT